MSFVHLHQHSELSLLDGLSSIPGIVARAVHLGQNAVALTDHGWMSGAVQLVDAAAKAGIKPIVGSEVYVSNTEMLDMSGGAGTSYHLTLLVQNIEGYRNLMRLTSLAHLEGFHYKPRIDLDLLEKYNEGLIVLSGCIAGQLNRHIVAGEERSARVLIDWYVRIFGDRFFLETMYHGCTPDGVDIVREDQVQERDIAAWVADEGRKRGLPVIATNDAHYLTRDDGDAHDTLLCLGMGAWKHKDDRMRYPGEQERLYEFYMKSEEEMKECSPGFYWEGACDNTQVVADMVDDHVIPKHDLIMPRYRIPRDVGFECWTREGILI